MSENKYQFTEDLTDEEVYNLMDEHDLISKTGLQYHYIAFSAWGNRMVAARTSPEEAYYTAVARGNMHPIVVAGYKILSEHIDKHNNKLEESLSKRGSRH